MTLFEIDKALAEAIENAIDIETGEIKFEEIESLQMERDIKIKNIAMYIINLKAEAKELSEQERKFKERKQVAENKAKRLQEMLQMSLNGEPFKSTEVVISYRKSESVEITNEVDFELFAMDNPEYTKPAKIEANKTAIKDAIARGIVIPGCEVITKQNMQIK